MSYRPSYSGLSLGIAAKEMNGSFYHINNEWYYQNEYHTFKLVVVNNIGGEPGDPPQKERKVSTVEICDRCGAIGKDEVMSGLDLATPGERTTEYGICSMCRADFDSWMALAVNSRAGTSVTTKYVNEPKISEETRMLARVVAEEFARARETAQKAIGYEGAHRDGE